MPFSTKGIPARPRRGMTLLLVFLSATLGLSLWLGYQAVDAARSHRRTAEGVLEDYTEIAVSEYSRRVQVNLDRFFVEVFNGVPWRIRRGPPPPPEVLRRRLRDALRRVGCRCEGLRSGAVFIVADLHENTVESLPRSVPFGEKSRAAQMARSAWDAAPADRIALRAVGPMEGLVSPSLLFFNASLDESGDEGAGRALYVVMAEMEAASELFEAWYREEGLLPEAVVGSQPNDSLLHLSVHTSEGFPVFRSPLEAVEVNLRSDTLPGVYGNLVVEAAVRPDAASSLVIGGLPRSRLPLLLFLMFLTLGMGLAAFVQLGREAELARLRDDFISGVSHEFRTPLTQIRMFTELLADGKLRTDGERDRSTEVVNREARRLTHLVENVLHFSRVGQGPAGQGTFEDVPAEEAFRDLTEAFEPLAQAGGCTLETRIDPPKLKIRVSRGGLHQMLANLLDNALKYGPRGQTVRIRASARDGRVLISVEDEGPGIPAREKDRIWEPYRRLERDVAGQVQGSGIGLAVVAELAEAAGGSARVDEGVEEGARFVLDLPSAAPYPPEGRTPLPLEERN